MAMLAPASPHEGMRVELPHASVAPAGLASNDWVRCSLSLTGEFRVPMAGEKRRTQERGSRRRVLADRGPRARHNSPRPVLTPRRPSARRSSPDVARGARATSSNKCAWPATLML